MNRRKRDYTHHLRAFWKRRYPERPNPEFKEFHDDILTVADFLMFQIDPSGSKPVLFPPAILEGAEPGPTVKPSGKRGRARE